MCCLGVAVLLLGGVLFAMSNARREGGGSLPWPFGSSDQAPVAEPVIGEAYAVDSGSGPGAEPSLVDPAAAPAHSGSGPLGAPVDPHVPPRSSGQTIIAFDDEEDDW